MDTVHECDRQTDRQTDGQTDGQTDRITITDTVQTASHGKNYERLCFRHFANWDWESVTHEVYGTLFDNAIP